jgi:hypothetical protein
MFLSRSQHAPSSVGALAPGLRRRGPGTGACGRPRRDRAPSEVARPYSQGRLAPMGPRQATTACRSGRTRRAGAPRWSSRRSGHLQECVSFPQSRWMKIADSDVGATLIDDTLSSNAAGSRATDFLPHPRGDPVCHGRARVIGVFVQADAPRVLTELRIGLAVRHARIRVLQPSQRVR